MLPLCLQRPSCQNRPWLLHNEESKFPLWNYMGKDLTAQACIVYLTWKMPSSVLTLALLIWSILNRDRQFSKHFCHESGGQTLAQVAQRDYGVAIHADIQIPTGHGLAQPAVGDPAWARGLDQMILMGPLQPWLFCDSVNVSLQQENCSSCIGLCLYCQ